MTFAFSKKLTRYKQWKNAIHGYIKAFEVTYNWETEEYHPHFHLILAVKPEYFPRKNGLYILQDEWCKMWGKALNADYKPVCYIQELKESEKGRGKEVAEVTKYVIKPSNCITDLINIKHQSQELQDFFKTKTDKISEDVIKTLDYTLKNRKLMVYSGVFREIKRQLNINEDDDLVHTEVCSISGDDNSDYIGETYRWDYTIGNYIQVYPNYPN